MQGILGDDADLLLFCAFRYALGRRTYIVEDIADQLIKHKNLIRWNTKLAVKSEITYAIDNCEAGQECDIKAWQRVLEAL